MDFDLDLKTDEVQHILNGKLLEIKTENEELAKTLFKREEMRENVEIRQEISLEIENVWKKIFGDKFIIGIDIKNEENVRLGQTNVLLHWGSTCPLIYSISLFSQHPTLVSSLNTSGCILIVISIPQFTDKFSYNIHGFIHYDTGQALKIPKIEISFEDYFRMNHVQISRSNVQDLLAICASSEKFGLIFKLPPTDHRQINDLFGTFFTKVLNQNYYILPESSSSSWAVLEVEQTNNLIFVVLYTKNDVGARILLHSFYRNIKNVKIVPNFDNFRNGTIADLKESLWHECRLISDIAKAQNHVSKLLNLTDLELKNDLLYHKIKEEIKFSCD